MPQYHDTKDTHIVPLPYDTCHSLSLSLSESPMQDIVIKPELGER